MKERPIIFSAPMVQAILAGRKTQTRRVVKFTPYDPCDDGIDEQVVLGNCKCPYGIPGDRLWVRETWKQGFAPTRDSDGIIYKADKEKSLGMAEYNCRWKPSIHMPKFASRILLEITDVQVHRVGQINAEDAKAEGIEVSSWEYSCSPYKNYMIGKPGYGDSHNSHPVASFRSLWDSINAKRGFGWAENPWVWAISFKVVKP